MMLPFEELIKKHNLNITGVLHLGANTGQERDLYDRTVNGEILWVEAIPNVFEELKKNLKPYPKQTAIKACISDKDNEKVVFNISNNESQSSSMLDFGEHRNIHPEVEFIDCIVLNTTRMDTLFNLLERDVSKLNMINADLQGAELMALKGMGKYLNQFDYLILELNNQETYKGCALVSEIDEYLSDYKRVETGNWVGGCWSDGLYIKHSLL